MKNRSIKLKHLFSQLEFNSIGKMDGTLCIYDALGDLLKKDVIMKCDTTHNKKVLRYGTLRILKTGTSGGWTYPAVVRKVLRCFIGIM
jgi:hypothetical protein